MIYQDSVADSLDAEISEPESASEPAARLWHHHPPASQRLLTAAEIDMTLAHGSSSARQLNAASTVPFMHHGQRYHESRFIHRSERHRRRSPRDEAVKRLLDIVGAVALALLLSPFLLIVGLLLLRDRGPILYSHSRTGRHGKTFGCLKFRTMIPDAEQALRELLHQNPKLQLEWMRDQKLRNDPRVTTVGRFLRRTSLDELPQLWNVFKGDMSLVGPRPVIRDEWQRYGRHLDTYLTARPGVTGLWQVMGRSNSCYRRRVALDSYYVRKRTLLLDAFILVKTVKVVLAGRGAY